MYKQSFKILFRNLLKGKIYSLVNLLGLAIGLASSFVILLHVVNELSYDRFNEDYQRIYRVITSDTTFHSRTPLTPYRLKEEAQANLTGIEAAARIYPLIDTYLGEEEDFSPEENFFCTDEELFSVLTIYLLKGEINLQPGNIMLSESAAKRYFGNEYGLEEVLKVKRRGQLFHFTVKGVFRDLPANSTLKPDVMAGIDLALQELERDIITYGDFPEDKQTYFRSCWDCNFFGTYLKIDKNIEPVRISESLSRMDDSGSANRDFSYKLQPLKDIYFNSANMFSFTESGNKKNVWLFGSIGFIILLLGAINYVLLTTARSGSRTKEISVKKITGASTRIIRQQVIMESLLTVFIALPVAVLFVELSTSYLNQLLGTHLKIYAGNTWLIIGYVMIAIIVGLTSGSYISLYLVRFSPIQVLKKQNLGKPSKPVLNNYLIIFQLVVFIALVFSTLAIFRQLYFFQNANPGYNREQIISIPMKDEKLQQYYPLIKEKIASVAGVTHVSGSLWGPPSNNTFMMTVPKFGKKDETIKARSLFVDYQFTEVMGIEIKEGRTFSREFGSDHERYLVNEKARKMMEIKEIPAVDARGNEVIGVVENFHPGSFHTEIPPLIIKLNPGMVKEILVKISSGNMINPLNQIERILLQQSPDGVPEFMLLNDKLELLYKEEFRFTRIVRLFTYLAIIVASLGLLGMSFFIAERKTREIGIRKVNGAKAIHILGMLLGNHILLLLVANIIALPVAHYFITRWMQKFTYHAGIEWWIFGIAIILSFFIVLLTMGYKTVKVAFSNPVESLRYE
ncbi:MAG: ABC transporter permease [Bacteroidales bacterium]